MKHCSVYRDSLTEVGRDTGDDGPSTAAAAGTVPYALVASGVDPDLH